MKIWDGRSDTRPDPSVRSGPDAADWKTITGELQETQKFVSNLAENVGIMPGLQKEISDRAAQIRKLGAELGKLTPPSDLWITIKTLGIELDALRGIYTHAAEVLETVQLLQQQILNLGRRIDSHIDDTSRWQRSMDNKVQTQQRVNEERVGTRLKALEDQLGVVSLALGMKSFGA